MMETLLVYIGKVAVLLAVFYLFYRCLLAKEAWHRFNRVMLWLNVMLAFALPFCVITTEKVVHVKEMLQAVQVNDGMVMAEEGMVAATENPIDGMTILFCIYVVGVCVALVWILISIARVKRIISCGKKMQLEGDNITLVLTEKQTEPFSWMHFVVMTRKDYETGNRAILLHEQAHVRMFHSVDVLLINLVCALQWFNPAAWLMRKNLKEIHEYEADAATLQSGISLKSYQDLLIKKAVGTSGHSIANSLNHSSLKNRLTMMYLKKSCMKSALKALYALPIVGISMAATAKTIVVYEYDKSETSITSLSEDKVMQKTMLEQTKTTESIHVQKKELKLSKAEEKETAKETNELVVDSISPKNATNRNVVRSDEEVIYTNLQEILSENEDIAELVLRALVKRFPNATYQADEGFRINGKEVKKIVFDGKNEVSADLFNHVKLNLPEPEEPLVVINGQEAKILDILLVSPDDISDMTVLKGTPATAIYGEKGKNGAIQINTKQNAPISKEKQ